MQTAGIPAACGVFGIGLALVRHAGLAGDHRSLRLWVGGPAVMTLPTATARRRTGIDGCRRSAGAGRLEARATPFRRRCRHAERHSDGAHRIRKRPRPQETSGSGPGGEQPADRPGRVPFRASGERMSEPPGISGPLSLHCRLSRPAGTCDARSFTAVVPVSSKVAIQGEVQAGPARSSSRSAPKAARRA